MLALPITRSTCACSQQRRAGSMRVMQSMAVLKTMTPLLEQKTRRSFATTIWRHRVRLQAVGGPMGFNMMQASRLVSAMQ
jgi:hypothetical protein